MSPIEEIKIKFKSNLSKKISTSLSLRHAIQELIEDNILTSGSLLPIEKEMINYLDVSYFTLRKTLDSLERDGLIIREKRVGVRISSNIQSLRTNIGMRVGIVYLYNKEIAKASHNSNQFLSAFFSECLFNNIEVVPIQCQKIEDIENAILLKNVNALIILPDKVIPYYKMLDNIKIPKILYDISNTHPGCDNIYTDSTNGYKMAIKELQEIGLQEYSYLLGLTLDQRSKSKLKYFIPPSAKNRLNEYQISLTKLGKTFNPNNTYQVNYDDEDMDLLIKKLKKNKKLPSVFFVLNDGLAKNLIKSLRKIKAKIPEEICVVGYGNYSKTNQYSNLSTIRPDWTKMASLVKNRIIVKLKDDTLEDTTIKVPSTFQKGYSTPIYN